MPYHIIFCCVVVVEVSDSRTASLYVHSKLPTYVACKGMNAQEEGGWGEAPQKMWGSGNRIKLFGEVRAVGMVQ